RTSAASNRTVWIFGGLVLLAAALLFNALNSRREALTAPATEIVPSGGARVTAPPPLTLPPQFRERGPQEGPSDLQPALQRPVAATPAPPPQIVTRIVERPVPTPAEPEPVQPSFMPRPSVIEAPAQRPSTPASETAPV